MNMKVESPGNSSDAMSSATGASTPPSYEQSHIGPKTVSGKPAIALPPASATIDRSIPTAAAALGPASKTYVIPPRAKPGRKPKQEEDTGDRRKQQNREAQRTFRDRRAQKVVDLSEQLDDMRREREQMDSGYQLRIHHLTSDAKRMEARHAEDQRTINGLNQQVESLQQKVRELDEQTRQLQRSQKTNIGTVQLPPRAPRMPRAIQTPPEDTGMEDFAIDFTTSYSAKRNDTQSLYGTVEACGFCTDDTVCACRDAAQAEPPTPVRVATKPKTAPGGCDKCLNDPEQARRCKEMAEYARYKDEEAQRRSSNTLPLPFAASTAAADRVTCSAFFEKLPPIDHSREYVSVLKRIHPYPYSHTADGKWAGSHFPAMEIDAAEAASALTDLARSTPAVEKR